MKFVLNNEAFEIPHMSEITVTKLLEYKQWSYPLIIVKINGKLITRDTWQTTTIHEEDTVDAIHLVSGG